MDSVREAVIAVLYVNNGLADVWRWVVVASAAFLIALGLMFFTARNFALRFMDGFATSILTNSLEAFLRFIAGLGIMGASPEMRFSSAFFWFGAFLSVTAIAMVFLLKLHRSYGERVKPLIHKIAPFYGVSSIAMGGFLLWALLS